jgi:hypothetical protein
VCIRAYDSLRCPHATNTNALPPPHPSCRRHCGAATLPLPPRRHQAAADAASHHQHRQLQLPHRCSHHRRCHTAVAAVAALPMPPSCCDHRAAAKQLQPSCRLGSYHRKKRSLSFFRSPTFQSQGIAMQIWRFPGYIENIRFLASVFVSVHKWFF